MGSRCWGFQGMGAGLLGSSGSSGLKPFKPSVVVLRVIQVFGGSGSSGLGIQGLASRRLGFAALWGIRVDDI